MDSDLDQNITPPLPAGPPAAPRRRLWLPLVEAALVLLVAFGTSILLGVFALVGTAVLVEDRGPLAALFDQERKLEIELSPAEGETAPSIEETRSTVAGYLEQADLIVVPSQDGTWNLVAWTEVDPDEVALARLTSELSRMGWGDLAPRMTTQPRYLGAMQNPRRMRVYIPPTMTLQALCFIVFAVAVLRWRRPPAFKPASPRWIALSWGAGSALAAFMASSVIGFLMHLTDLKVEEQPWIQALMADRGSLLTLLPWLVVIGPLSEEVFFRGYVFRRLWFHGGPVPAYALSALLFALIHWHPVGFPMYAIIGLIFCWVYRRTGNLWAPIAGHMIYNGIVVLLPLFAPTAQ